MKKAERAVHLLGFCSALQRLLSTQPWGWGDSGRAHCLPSAGEIQQTPTREPTETLSKTNSAEGAGLECVAGRVGEGEVRGCLPAGGDSAVLCGLGWLPAGAGVREVCTHVCSPPSGCQVRASHSFSCQV